jgi:hypothetical protein
MIDWSKAPKDVTHYAGGKWWKYYSAIGWLMFDDKVGDYIHNGEFPLAYADYTPRPKEWPTEERIDIISTNGGDGLHYDDIKEQQETKPTLPQNNKYDRTIVGKYGSGKCVVDVYRVLNAFPTGSPEIDHAVKKLLASGKRGAKDELQDLREAIQSIEARINYLSDTGA